MKKIILSLAFVLGCFAISFAQPDGKRGEKVKALYIAYITDELNITSTEAQSFWPLYAQYDTEMQSVLKPNMAELDKQQAVLNIKKNYQDRFQKVLGAERTNLFYVKDSEFKKRMIERLRNMREKQGQGGRQ